MAAVFPSIVHLIGKSEAQQTSIVHHPIFHFSFSFSLSLCSCQSLFTLSLSIFRSSFLSFLPLPPVLFFFFGLLFSLPELPAIPPVMRRAP